MFKHLVVRRHCVSESQDRLHELNTTRRQRILNFYWTAGETCNLCERTVPNLNLINTAWTESIKSATQTFSIQHRTSVWIVFCKMSNSKPKFEFHIFLQQSLIVHEFNRAVPPTVKYWFFAAVGTNREHLFSRWRLVLCEQFCKIPEVSFHAPHQFRFPFLLHYE